MSSPTMRAASTPLSLLALVASTFPTLLAYNVSPSPTFLNQALALALWAGFAMALRPAAGGGGRGPTALYVALAGVLVGVAWSWGPGALPTGLALSAIGLLLAAAVLAGAGAAAHARPDAADTFAAVCTGLAVAGGLNVTIAAVQVFMPEWTDGRWIATSSLVGRAVGNLRQPNHLSSLLLWAAIAVVALAELRRLRRPFAAVLFGLLVFAVVLTGSRTGLVGMVVLVLWALLDRRLSRWSRVLLLAAPLVYAACFAGLAEWSRMMGENFGAATRFGGGGDPSSSRFAIWSNTLALIARHPWVGVGFGEFNFAWTLTPFPDRPVAFFDHTHNLPLQLAVELGLPLALLVMGALLVSLVSAFAVSWRAEGDLGIARRAALVMVVMIGLHSLLEYPLWYAYFLLPATWLLAFAGGSASLPRVDTASRPLTVGALAVVLGSVLSVLDYLPSTAIFNPAASGTLEQRIARGQRSLLFAHHADYAAATTTVGGGTLEPFDRATHFLLDTRLMTAWARALAAAGEVDAARHVAARLREFRNAAADEFFAPCEAPAVADAPFQCQPPERPHDWREFLR
jgi:O-antigen ligase